MAGVDNFCKLIVRPFHATPATCVVRAMPSGHNSTNRWPVVADVRTGTVFGEGQFHQQEYLTGTMSAGAGGTVVYTFVG